MSNRELQALADQLEQPSIPQLLARHGILYLEHPLLVFAMHQADVLADAGCRMVPSEALLTVTREVIEERVRQHAKWGEQNHPNGTGPNKLPMPTGSDSWAAAIAAERLSLLTNCATQVGHVTWLHILREEVFEAFAESDPAKLRAELIQVAAVAVQWVEAIDREGSA